MSNIDILISIDTNLRNYFKDKSVEHFINVFDVMYFEHGFEVHLNGENTKSQIHAFIDEFIGLNEWANIIYDIHHPEGFFNKASLTTRDILSKIRLLMGSISIDKLKSEQSKKALSKINSKIKDLENEINFLDNDIKIIDSNKKDFVNKKELKKDLQQAIEDSYEDGIFWKDNGWCNVSDVLVKYNLIKLKD